MDVDHINGEGSLIAELFGLLHQSVCHVKKIFLENLIFLFYFVFLFLGRLAI